MLINKFIAVTTDSPSVMVCFRSIITTKHPHIIKLRCILHDLNTMAKWILKSENARVKVIIKSNKILVNYFTESFYYDEVLQDWRKSNDVNHGLETYSESRWYSFAKVFRSVDAHEDGFKKCKSIHLDRTIDSVPLTVPPLCKILFRRKTY